MPANSTPERFVEAARSYLGVRWHHLGRTRDAVDCVGLLLLAARDCGMEPPEPAPYAKGYRGPAMIAELNKLGRRVEVKDRRVGDVLAFKDGRHIAHVGVLSMRHGVEHVVHAAGRARMVIEELLAGHMLADLRGVRRPYVFED